MGADCSKHRHHRFTEQLSILSSWIQPLISQNRREQFVIGVEERNTTGLQLFQITWLEHQRPTVHWRTLPQHLSHQLTVNTQSRCTPQIGYPILISRIKALQLLHQHWIHMLQIGQLGMVKALKGTSLHQTSMVSRGRHDHIKPRTPRQ